MKKRLGAFLALLLLCFTIFVLVERFYFVTFGSIFPLRDTSAIHSLDEFSDTCKRSGSQNVLEIIKYDDGRIYAKCGSGNLIKDVFKPVYDITRLVKDIRDINGDTFQ